MFLIARFLVVLVLWIITTEALLFMFLIARFFVVLVLWIITTEALLFMFLIARFLVVLLLSKSNIAIELFTLDLAG
jgi:hypothetical protein